MKKKKKEVPGRCGLGGRTGWPCGTTPLSAARAPAGRGGVLITSVTLHSHVHW